MAASEIEQWWIDKFQENLGPIRKVAGWTTQQLADELGVARQTVSNLETGKSPMTKLQYLALRTVFSAEIARREDRDLARIIKTLVDDPIEQRIRERLPCLRAVQPAQPDRQGIDARGNAAIVRSGRQVQRAYILR